MTTANRHPRKTVLPLIVLVGALVGGNFSLAKHVVTSGISPLLLFEWQVLGAGLVLCGVLALRFRSDLAALATRPVLFYCLVNGLLGVSVPQVLSYFALQQVPAGLFTMLVTLSPLLTFCLSSLAARKLLPMRRLAGILIGLAGVTAATAGGNTSGGAGLVWLAAAMLTPLFLAIANVYRERAMPAGANPLALASGTLVSQAVLFLPVMLFPGGSDVPAQVAGGLFPAVLCLCAVTALSYVLTFELYRRTDGVGFSQVGYFVTLSGIAAGAFFFGEQVTPWFAFSTVLLFAGMALSNSRASLPRRRLAGSR
ncbi:DMT family transporter [Roseibium sp. Sym1]|uniref:DMT family transporter n=1 Tax=Roseibium sp. Sym1 TaxID=3016006 RepID=UPI0022B47C13|nr:DMT family transporter [Roseibium sp. Sym1]